MGYDFGIVMCMEHFKIIYGLHYWVFRVVLLVILLSVPVTNSVNVFANLVRKPLYLFKNLKEIILNFNKNLLLPYVIRLTVNGLEIFGNF